MIYARLLLLYSYEHNNNGISTEIQRALKFRRLNAILFPDVFFLPSLSIDIKMSGHDFSLAPIAAPFGRFLLTFLPLPASSRGQQEETRAEPSNKPTEVSNYTR